MVSFAGARVALAVGSALAAVLCCRSHLRSLKECLLRSNADNKGLGGSLLREAHVRIHLASSAAVAALAASSAATVSSAARHFLERESC